jgi:hypothetical protein
MRAIQRIYLKDAVNTAAYEADRAINALFTTED